MAVGEFPLSILTFILDFGWRAAEGCNNSQGRAKGNARRSCQRCPPRTARSFISHANEKAPNFPLFFAFPCTRDFKTLPKIASHFKEA